MQDVTEKLNAYSLGLNNYLNFLEKISSIPALSHVNDKFAQLLTNVVSKIMKAREKLQQFFLQRKKDNEARMQMMDLVVQDKNRQIEELKAAYER